MSVLEWLMPPPPAEGERSFWSSVREALKGSHQDFTTGNLNRAILLLAIPMVLEMVLESLFAVTDVFWVGRLGANAVATVGITESMLALVFAIGLGVSMSTTAMVSRRIGEKDPEDAAIAAVQAIGLGLLISLALGIPAGIYAPELLRAMGASPEIVSTGSGYARIALGGCGAIIMLFLNNAIFRGAGDAAIAMRLLWISNIINLILDPCLIFGLGPFPRLGVTGAALATFTGRSIGVLYQFYRLLKGTERIHVLWRQVRLHASVMLRLMRVSMTGILQFAIANTSWIVLVRIISIFGATAVAGYTIAIRIVVFFILPAWGLSNAAATLVGQNLGAKRPDRAAQAVWRTSVYNVIFLGVLGIFFVVFATPVVRLFVHDAAVVPIAATALRTFACGNVGYAYVMVMLQAFNGAGDTLTPTIVNFFGFWLLELPLAWWLAIGMRLGQNGAFLSVVIAECSIAVPASSSFGKASGPGSEFSHWIQPESRCEERIPGIGIPEFTLTLKRSTMTRVTDAQRMKADVRIPVLIAAPFVFLAAIGLAHRSAGELSNVMAAGPALEFNTQLFPVGHGPASIAVADVNHDGKLDIIVANTVDGTVDVLLGDGKGRFTRAAGSPFACGQNPNDVATGDFNGDGNLDLMIANTETPYLTILLGDGKGGFAPAPDSPFNTHSYPHVHGAAAADFNGDGKLDVVTDNWGRNQILMFLGDGKGNLMLPGQAFKTGKRPYQRLRSADFNKDGKADVVTTDLDQNAVSILLGDGKGALRDAPGSPFPAGRAPWAVAIDDMNHDGNLDLVIVPYAPDVPDPRDVGVTVLLGDGKGGFRKMPGSPFSLAGCEGPDRVATGDINGDRSRDIVVTCGQNNRLMLYLGSRDGFTISTQTVKTGWAGIAIADLTGRGKDDIIVSNGLLDKQPRSTNGTITILSSK